MALDRLTNICKSDDDLELFLPLAKVYKFVKDKTDLCNLDIDEMYLAYYRLLLEG